MRKFIYMSLGIMFLLGLLTFACKRVVIVMTFGDVLFLALIGFTILYFTYLAFHKKNKNVE